MYLFSEEINWHSHIQSETQQNFFVLTKAADDVSGLRRRKFIWLHCSKEKVCTSACHYV